MPNFTKSIAWDESCIKFSNGTQGVFEGYASVFNVVDSDLDIILPGAFKTALSAATVARGVAMHFNHRRFDIPVGKWLHLEEDSKGLFARGELTKGHSTAEDLRAAMAHGTVPGLSVGFGTDKSGFDINPQGGRTFRDIKKLSEISVCTTPANEAALHTGLKSVEALETIRDVEDWLRDAAGLSRATAQSLIAQAKSAIRRESEGDGVTALVRQITSFPQSLKGN